MDLHLKSRQNNQFLLNKRFLRKCLFSNNIQYLRISGYFCLLIYYRFQVYEISHKAN